MPSDPVMVRVLGEELSRPNSVTFDGLECTVAPQISIIVRRYGFCRYDAATCQTSHSMPY